MTDILLNDRTHDLEITGYDLQLVTRQDLVKQRIRQNLRFFRGEWYLAVDEGVPYFQEILRKGADIMTVESILKTAIVQTEGVDRLLEFSMDYDGSARRLTVTFKVITNYGTLTGSEDL